MRNPNRFGTVTKLSGKRRRPYIVKEGKTGHQRVIGYAATREEGLMLLSEYNKSPWDVEAHRLTFAELYSLWLEKRAVKLSKSSYGSLRSAYGHCRSLDALPYHEIKPYQMQDCIDSCGRGYATQWSIKNLFVHLDKFALELGISEKRYADLLTCEPIPETSKKVFTDDEVNRLWANQRLDWVDSVLFFLYSGFRISEMLSIRLDAVDLAAQTITGGTKTAAGKNRVVPIHSKIQGIVAKRVKVSKSGYLFEYRGRKIDDSKYRMIWEALMAELGMRHTPHECRHTFRSRLDSAGANKVCIDRLMGHKSAGTGERVYTHKDIKELRFNLELITN